MKRFLGRLSICIGVAVLASAIGVHSTFAAVSVTFGFEAGMITNVPTQDNYLLEAAPTLNRGTYPLLQWSDVPGDERRVLWQISNEFTNTIPQGSTIVSATLKFINLGSSTPLTTGSVYRVLVPWAETTTTWNLRDTSGPTAWAAPGMSIGTDVAATPFISDQAFPSITNGGVFAFNITGEMQYWLDNPASNHGIAWIAALNAPEISWGSNNRGAGNETEMPRLEVTFIPEPSAILLGVPAWLVLSIRRRPCKQS